MQEQISQSKAPPATASAPRGRLGADRGETGLTILLVVMTSLQTGLVVWSLVV